VTQPYARIHERLSSGQTVILDGGVGSELVRRGVRWRDHGLRTDAAAVQALHAEYLAAGADVVRTNTFQLNRRIYQNVFRDTAHMRHIGAPDLEQRVTQLVPLAVSLARAARELAGCPEAAIAGVMSPLEHCFRPDLTPAAEDAIAEHTEIANMLAANGVDLLLLESMNTIGEAKIAAEAARATGSPVWVSFVVDERGNVLSGESLSDAHTTAQAIGADAVLLNCAPPEDIESALMRLETRNPPVGAYAHIGYFDPPSWKFEFFPQFTSTEAWLPERYAAAAAGWQSRGARIIGGCCGTGPDHIRALALK
jgi:S-methylmethionine-dependent homocysteine/selenocysteine methylase